VLKTTPISQYFKSSRPLKFYGVFRGTMPISMRYPYLCSANKKMYKYICCKIHDCLEENMQNPSKFWTFSHICKQSGLHCFMQAHCIIEKHLQVSSGIHAYTHEVVIYMRTRILTHAPTHTFSSQVHTCMHAYVYSYKHNTCIQCVQGDDCK
jgi:hypothetical protein